MVVCHAVAWHPLCWLGHWLLILSKEISMRRNDYWYFPCSHRYGLQDTWGSDGDTSLWRKNACRPKFQIKPPKYKSFIYTTHPLSCINYKHHKSFRGWQSTHTEKTYTVLQQLFHPVTSLVVTFAWQEIQQVIELSSSAVQGCSLGRPGAALWEELAWWNRDDDHSFLWTVCLATTVHYHLKRSQSYIAKCIKLREHLSNTRQSHTEDTTCTYKWIDMLFLN